MITHPKVDIVEIVKTQVGGSDIAAAGRAAATEDAGGGTGSCRAGGGGGGALGRRGERGGIVPGAARVTSVDISRGQSLCYQAGTNAEVGDIGAEYVEARIASDAGETDNEHTNDAGGRKDEWQSHTEKPAHVSHGDRMCLLFLLKTGVLVELLM